jgi:hypothetical protein
MGYLSRRVSSLISCIYITLFFSKSQEVFSENIQRILKIVKFVTYAQIIDCFFVTVLKSAKLLKG